NCSAYTEENGSKNQNNECTFVGLARGKPLARRGRKTIGIVSHAHAQLWRYGRLIWICVRRVAHCTRTSYNWSWAADADVFGCSCGTRTIRWKIICWETSGTNNAHKLDGHFDR
ncbi:hypothetical protein M5D96_002252, partial [Drosophila gunungcola]